MADVPLSIAVISTITPVIAGVLPLTAAWLKDVGREKRAEGERQRAEQVLLARKKQADCVRLLRFAREFRVLVENTYDSTGPELDANAEQVRQSAVRLASQADKVEFMIAGVEGEALSLAEASRRLGAPIAAKKNREHGASLLPPDFGEFDRSLVDFKRAAHVALGHLPTPADCDNGKPARR